MIKIIPPLFQQQQQQQQQQQKKHRLLLSSSSALVLVLLLLVQFPGRLPVLNCAHSAHSFPIQQQQRQHHQRHHQQQPSIAFMSRMMAAVTVTESSTGKMTESYSSTILLLEHINLNLPHHDTSSSSSSSCHAIQFYIHLLGCGYDPRRFQNVISMMMIMNSTTTGSKYGTIWANCGKSQFHLPYGTIPQSIFGKIGLRIQSSHWPSFQQRVMDTLLLQQQHQQQQSIEEKEEDESILATTLTTGDGSNNNNHHHHNIIKAVTKGMDRYQNEYIEITDPYQNIFYCRPTTTTSTTQQQQQPIVTRDDPKYIQLYGSDVLNQCIPSPIGTTTSTTTTTTTGCCGIDFIEFYCPIGSAERIATFYNTVLDVEVNVIEQVQEPPIDNIDNDTNSNNNNNHNNNNNNKMKKKKSIKENQQPPPLLKMAIIAIGNIDSETGRTDQSLLFREIEHYETRYQQHYHDNENVENENDSSKYHIAIYVGETVADFQQAYRNCEVCDLIYINPRFSDKANTLELATNVYHQFRIQHIIDIASSDGTIIMELEHEIRSIQHEAWIGKRM